MSSAFPPLVPAQLVNGNNNALAIDGSTAISVDTATINQFHAAPPRTVDPAALAAAHALLDTLPRDTLPEPSGLPPGSVLPFPRNRTFIGREPNLKDVARQIIQGGTAAVGQSPAVTGMGGQGKSQLAIEFAYRYGRYFAGGVFWVSCANPAAIPEAIAACGPALHPTELGFSARSLPDRLALVVSAWSSEMPRLLIFDNCEDEALLDDWLPRGGGCRLLLTARRASWSPARGITALPLGGLPPTESLALLHRHRPDLAPDDPGLAEVAEELGHLPLALELAGSYLALYQRDPDLIGTPAAYLAELRASDVLAHASLAVEDPGALDQSPSPTGHELHVARTFEVSLRRLRADELVDALALEVLARAVWLAPGLPIPQVLLKRCAGIAVEDAGRTLLFTPALSRLLNLALLERTSGNTDAVVLHRLVAVFARARLDQARSARDTLETALANEARRLLLQSNTTSIREWEGHLLAVALAAERDRTRSAVELLNAAGRYGNLIADEIQKRSIIGESVSWQWPLILGKSDKNILPQIEAE